MNGFVISSALTPLLSLHTHAHPADHRDCRGLKGLYSHLSLYSQIFHMWGVRKEGVEQRWKKGERGKTGILVSQEKAQYSQIHQELQNISNHHCNSRQMVLYKLDTAAIPVKLPISPTNLNHHFEYWWLHLSRAQKIRLLAPYLDLKLSSWSDISWSISRKPKEIRSH